MHTLIQHWRWAVKNISLALAFATVFAIGCSSDGSASGDGGMSADVNGDTGTTTPPSGSGIRGLFRTYTGFGAIAGESTVYGWQRSQRTALGRAADSMRIDEVASAQSGSVWRTADGAVRGPWIPGETSEPAVRTRLPSGVVQLAAGQTSFVARMASGEIHHWSINRTPSTTFPGITDAAFVVFALRRNNEEVIDVVRRDGSVLRIARGSNGMVAAQPVAGLTGVAKMSAGTDFECALSTAGAVRCFGGTNSAGQLGDGGTMPRPDPAGAPEILQGAAEISSGMAHTCARMTNGTVQCWGSNGVGQLGRPPSNTPGTAPMAVPDLTGVTAVVSSGVETCALTQDGSVWCWGGTTAPAPTRVVFNLV